MSIRHEYEQHGVAGYYQQFGAAYRNPHELAVRHALHAAVAAWGLDLTRVLDLACGSGEATLALREVGAAQVDGVDPYTAAAYALRTGQPAETISFEAIAAGALDGRRYSLILCSYALHLLEPSRLPQLAYQLSRIAPALLVLTPHKRPDLRPAWGWTLTHELRVERVRVRAYQALAAPTFEAQPMSKLLDRLALGPLLADGAMGTMLHAQGVAFDHSFDALNLLEPAVVAAVHRHYIEAGADLIVTNTFGANRFKLAPAGLGERVAEVNQAAVALARGVATAAAKDVLVAGDVGPLGVRLAPFGRVKPEQAYAAFHEQITALVAAGVDLILIETMSDLDEVAAAVQAAQAVGGVPIISTMTFTRDDRTLLGDGPAQVGAALAKLGADLIGVNCSGGPAQVLRLLRALRQAAPQARFWVKPNAGWPEHVGGRIMYPASPEYFGEYALAFVEAGASIVGGCCGTTPTHIAAMRRALDAPARPPSAGDVVAVERRAEHREDNYDPDQPTRLARLAAGHFVVGVEMDPPRGFSPHKLLAGASLLAEAGADVINVADAPMARMRMSAWAAAHLIQREVGLEAVLHFPTRGRNLLRVQGDLLAAHALGVRNVFVVMGDPTAIGDYPTANDNYDVVPSGLIKLIKQGFNAGVDAAGAGIGQPTTFLVGCAVNLAAADVAKEIKTLNKKILAGADFGLTQPVYAAGPARAFMARYAEAYGPLKLPILVGVLPLFNARHAAFLHNEVPGIIIPDALRERMAAAGEGSPAAAEGVNIAVDLLAELRDVVQGAYLMPPFGRYDLAAEILDRVQVKPAVGAL